MLQYEISFGRKLGMDDSVLKSKLKSAEKNKCSREWTVADQREKLTHTHTHIECSKTKTCQSNLFSLADIWKITSCIFQLPLMQPVNASHKLHANLKQEEPNI